MQKSVFFKGLNEIRAIAALAVIWHHIELYKSRLKLSSLISNSDSGKFFKAMGLNSVLIFFTLSGFLITYLLLSERDANGRIDIPKFYFRRVLRIWPLYFVILLIGFFFLPNLYAWFPGFFEGQYYYNERVLALSYGKNLLLFVFFMSNIAMGLFPPVVGSSQSWSVSVEEQFYLLWPWVIQIFRNYLVVTLILIVVGVQCVQKFFFMIPGFLESKFLLSFVYSFHIDFMAIGALFAYLYYSKPAFVKSVVGSWLFLLVACASGTYHVWYGGNEIVKAISFAALILCAIEWGLSISVFNFLGKISYGMYMYHPLMMYIVFAAFYRSGLNVDVWLTPFVYVGVVGGTIALSLVSYRFLELPLLRFKDGFAKVKSGSIEI